MAIEIASIAIFFWFYRVTGFTFFYRTLLKNGMPGKGTENS
jgi:hypothetical protein